MLRAGDLRRIPLRDAAVEICYVPWLVTRPATRCRRGNMLRVSDLRRFPLRDAAVETCYVPATCDASHYEMLPLKHATCR